MNYTEQEIIQMLRDDAKNEAKKRAKIRNEITPQVKQMVIERDNHTCQKCGRNSVYDFYEVDHIKPVSKGGTSELENLQLLCMKCNRAKGKRF